MNVIYAVFRSRTQALAFAGEMRARGVGCHVVATPSGLGMGCGLSVRLGAEHKSTAERVVRARNYDSFYAFVSVGRMNGTSFTKKI